MMGRSFTVFFLMVSCLSPITGESAVLEISPFEGTGIQQYNDSIGPGWQRPCRLSVNLDRNGNSLSYYLTSLCGETNDISLEIEDNNGQLFLVRPDGTRFGPVGNRVGNRFSLRWSWNQIARFDCQVGAISRPFQISLRNDISFVFEFKSVDSLVYQRDLTRERVPFFSSIPNGNMGSCWAQEQYLNEHKEWETFAIGGTLKKARN